MLTLDGSVLDCDQIARVAREGEKVALTNAALGKIATAHDQIAEVAARRPVYGRGTGVGANRTVLVSDAQGHGRRLLRSHAAASGPSLSADTVRAMLLIRLNQLAAGGSGVSPDTARGLQRLLNEHALPTVREHGSVGTGDLAALAGTALTLIGERPASRPWTPVADFPESDALPFISSNALTLGRITLALADLEPLVRAATVVAGLSFAAVRGNPEAFSEQAARATPFTGTAVVAEWLRELISSPLAAARIQDPFGYRVFPQAHGAVVDAVADLTSAVTSLAATAQENPLLVTAAIGEQATVVHHGGFHMAPLALRLDTARLAFAQEAPLLLGRIRTLTDPSYTQLTSFLAAGPPGSSGTMILEYVAGSAYGALRAAAAPASLETVVLSRGTEDDASFASLGARQLETTVHSYRTMIACELLHALRALAQRDERAAGLPSPLLAEAWRRCHDDNTSYVADHADRDLENELAAAEELLPVLAGLLPPTPRTTYSRAPRIPTSSGVA
ncbi:aromatic amino acid lyase [Saccharopolyspora shandongensis]|uniref:aromatic amino acid lyase n=1 Tax=Saccharopolyspora shandongensis TaxID=418495 RepID=UPI0033D965C4